MKHGQIRKLTGKLWQGIMGTFAMTPPVQEANAIVLERLSMPTPFTTTCVTHTVVQTCRSVVPRTGRLRDGSTCPLPCSFVTHSQMVDSS